MLLVLLEKIVDANDANRNPLLGDCPHSHMYSLKKGKTILLGILQLTQGQQYFREPWKPKLYLVKLIFGYTVKEALVLGSHEAIIKRIKSKHNY